MPNHGEILIIEDYIMNEEVVNSGWGLICIIWIIAIALFLTMYAPNITPSATNVDYLFALSCC